MCRLVCVFADRQCWRVVVEREAFLREAGAQVLEDSGDHAVGPHCAGLADEGAFSIGDAFLNPLSVSQKKDKRSHVCAPYGPHFLLPCNCPFRYQIRKRLFKRR